MKSTVFLSYSHRDEAWKDRFITQLNSLGRKQQFEVWHDRRIVPGSEWFTDIETAMGTAAIAVCLISPNFLQSSFCTQYEVGPLLARGRARWADRHSCSPCSMCMGDYPLAQAPSDASPRWKVYFRRLQGTRRLRSSEMSLSRSPISSTIQQINQGL